jgi:PBP1b-binding outer membrane lipoprotein LpoB
MKRLIYTLLLIVFITTGCLEKESVAPAKSKMEMLTGNSSKKWLMTAKESADPSRITRQCEVNTHIITLWNNMGFESDMTKCGGEIEKYKYELNSDTTKINFVFLFDSTEYRADYHITEITVNKLVLTKDYKDNEGIDYNIVYTYSFTN